MSNSIRVVIAGATGYTGSELVRLLLDHPYVEIAGVTSSSRAGTRFDEIYPQFTGFYEEKLSSTEEIHPDDFDAIFLGLPHGISMEFVKQHGYEQTPIIDLSGDFRLSSADLYNQWYPEKHVLPDAIADAAFGLPEWFGEQVRSANLIANPGCYPTSSILPLIPLIKSGKVDPASVVIDAKSGVTGAGANAKPNTHFPTVNDNFSVYGLMKHRHTPEIEDVTRRVTGTAPTVQFTPHLLPVSRGILTVVYGRSESVSSSAEVRSWFEEAYGDKPFIRINSKPPSLQEIRGTNFCNLYPAFDERTGNVIIISVIDNLVKGAAGQAIQNLNLRFGFPEETGLNQSSLAP